MDTSSRSMRDDHLDEALHARWTWLTILGLIMIAVAPLLLVGAALVWGLDVGDELPLLVAAIVLPSIAAFLVWRFGSWARVAAIVIAVLSVGALFWTAFGLALPSSFFDFVPGVLVVPGAIIAIVGAVASIVAKRRGHLTPEREGGERRATNIVVATLGVLVLLSATLTVATRSTVEIPADASNVTFKNFEFDQHAYTAAGGSQIAVVNDDPFAHTYTIDALGIDVPLGPSSSEVIDVPDQAGSYIVYCTLHTSDPEDPSDSDMAATLTIE